MILLMLRGAVGVGKLLYIVNILNLESRMQAGYTSEWFNQTINLVIVKIARSLTYEGSRAKMLGGKWRVTFNQK